MNQPSRPGILCGRCGSRHDTINEVRACSSDTSTAAIALESDWAISCGPPDWTVLCGPEALGRSLVISAGGPVPQPWAESKRVSIPAEGWKSPKLSELIITELQEAYSHRRRLVIECGGTLETPLDRIEAQLTEFEPSLDLPGSRLDHLIFSNSIDARDFEAPRVRMIDLAIAAGARPAGPGSPADVVGTDGSRFWCDGGPLESFSDDLINGVPVVPRVHLLAGFLRPIVHCVPHAELAPDQLEAVASPRGGARIVAPAGSGKTRVLTERARHLVQGLGIAPSTVCLVAFNVRARREMQERTTDLPGLEVRTLNSLALAICRGTGPFAKPNDNDLVVIDERRVRDHIRNLIKAPRHAMTDPFAAWIEALSACRLGLRDPVEVEREFNGDVPDLPRVIEAYRCRLVEFGEVDFDEQIIRAIEILIVEPRCRKAARTACATLLVDEFQDLTPAHLLLIRLLAGPAAEVFAVGDDDQTIYGYAGASPSWLIDFHHWFPGSVSHDLHINYRCPPEVIVAALNLLSHNRRRIPKQIEPPSGRDRLGDSPDSGWDPMRRISTNDQLEALTEVVNEMLAEGVPSRQIAVLTRVNATLLAPMITLRAAGIPTTTPVDAAYLSRTGVAAAVAWLRLATAAESSLPGTAIETAARRPPRGISPMVAGWAAEQRSVDQIERLASRLRTPRDRHKIEVFAADITSLRDIVGQGADTVRVLTAIREAIGLGSALDSRLDASRRSLDRSSHGDDLNALISVAGLQPDPALFPDWLCEQLVGRRDLDGPGVRLSTIHRVKGMQWPRVIVYGVDEGVLPHRLSTDLEEERRIFHVAITRSSEQTIVISTPTASPFIAELDAAVSLTLVAPGEVDATTTMITPTTLVAQPKAATPAKATTAEGNLFEQLRAWRSRVSRAAGVPAYVVFDNRTLEAIASNRPNDSRELLSITGIGPVKLERYGREILDIIADNQ